MFSCLCNYSRSGSMMRHHPLRDREREKGGQGSFVSFSGGKETKDFTASFSFASSASPFPLLPPTYSPFPLLLSLLDLDLQIHPYLSSRGEEEASAPQPPFPRKRRRTTTRRPSLLRRPPIPFVLPILLRPLLLPLLTHSPSRSRCVYCCVAQRVDCYVCLFRS